MDRHAALFAPQVEFLYNGGASAISKGCMCEWGGAAGTFYAQVEDPKEEEIKETLPSQSARPSGVKRAVPGLILWRNQTAASNYPVGVAMEDIAASAWGHVCVGGVCDVRIGTTEDIATADWLIATSDGTFVENTAAASAATFIHARALEATITSGACSAALIQALLILAGTGGYKDA
jgi:hypothetical protein